MSHLCLCSSVAIQGLVRGYILLLVNLCLNEETVKLGPLSILTRRSLKTLLGLHCVCPQAAGQPSIQGTSSVKPIILPQSQALPVKLLSSPVSPISTRSATSGQIRTFSPLVAGCGFPDFRSRSSEGHLSPDSVSTLTREDGRHRRARKTATKH